MKKLYIFLAVVALCAIGVSAKTIHIWRNGVKTDLAIQTNDSITFDNESAPVMRIWSNGGEVYQLSLAVDDSITYSEDKTPAAICFDYDHWRELDTINIFEFNGHVWQTIALPWADEVTTTIPDYYRFPNLESHIDSTTNDTVPTWQLAFNTCHNPALDGVHMFGLWNEKSNTMRIYSYLEELPNPNAAYCFYRVESSAPAFIDRDAMTWMPSQAVIQNGNWNAAALSGQAPAPSTQICDLMTFASLKNDGSEAFAPVFPGWVCFELPLGTGTFTVPENGSIKFSLEAVQHIDATGTVDFDLALQGTGTGTGTSSGLSKGNITIPGNKNKKTAGWLTAWGSFASGIGSAVTSGTSASGQDPDAGLAGAIIQGAGSVLSLIGNCMNAEEEGEDKKYGLSFSSKDTTNYSFNFNFGGTITGEFTAQLTSTLASTAKPLTITYAKLFENISAHKTTTQAQNAPKNGEDSIGNGEGLSLPLGIWNLKRQPEYYVSRFYAQIDNQPTLVSFLDPASIELELNMDNPFFDANELDSVKLIAYDYVFVDGNYGLSADPYYDFYGIERDTVKIEQLHAPINHHFKYAHYLLDTLSTYKTIAKGDRTYTGIASDSLAAYGFGMYNMVYSPAISADIHVGDELMVNEISVAVIVEMTFKNGEKRIFAERYLPVIKTYGLAGPAHFYNDPPSPAPDNINGIPLSCPLYNMQYEKAIRLLTD